MYTCRVYQICNVVDSEIYVGSTKQALSARLAGHKRDARRGKSMRVLDHIRSLGFEKFYIELLEAKEIGSREEQMMLETVWINKKQSSLNSRAAYCSRGETLAKKRTWMRQDAKNNPAKVKKIQQKYLAGLSEEKQVERKEKKAECHKRNYAARRDEILAYHKVYDADPKNKANKKEYDRQRNVDRKEEERERKRLFRQNNIRTGRFRCEACDKSLGSASELKIHDKRTHA